MGNIWIDVIEHTFDMYRSVEQLFDGTVLLFVIVLLSILWGYHLTGAGLFGSVVLLISE